MEYQTAFQLVNKYIEYPDSIPFGSLKNNKSSDYPGYASKLQMVPNLLLFYAFCLKAGNYAAAKSYMTSPLVWLNMMKFQYHNAYMYGGNMSDYFDIVVMRAYHRGLIKDIPDEMVQAALTFRVNKVITELEEFDLADPISQGNKSRLSEMYQE